MSVEHVAGTDTREAMASPTVRACVATAAAAAGPGWAAAFGMPAAWRAHVAMPASVQPWVAVALVAAGVGAALIAWRNGPMPPPGPRAPGAPAAPPPGLAPAILAVGLAVFAATQHDARDVALMLVLVPFAAGWLVGHAARLAVASCVPNVSSAAAGVVVAGGLFGLLFAGHLALVAKGSGPQRAAGWGAVYMTLAVVNMIRARRSFAGDLAIVASRSDPVIGVPGFAEPAADDAPAFSVQGIHVSFRNNHVLHGATFTTRAGELVALVGGNGAGKSTLLRVACGLIMPDRGRILVGGDDVTTLLPEERAAAGLAFVSGARPVFPDLTVTENLRVAAFRSHLTTRAFEEATEAVFELVPALVRRRGARAGVLSGGEQRLLAVAQMLYRRPTVLLADELSLGLDADARVAVMDLLRLLADQGVSAVVVDHDLPSLLSRASRAILLTGGDIESYDRPEELLLRRADLLPATFLAGANG